MSEFKGTPGPWFTGEDDDCETIYASDNGKQYDEANIIKVAIVMRDDGDYQKMEADARLIAAAPELLDALKHAIHTIEAIERDLSKHRPGTYCGANKARAAIAKALGETT